MVNSADLESSKRRGIKAKKFEAHLDSRTSRICRKHNQIVIPIDKITIGENAPPLHPYCRSFLSDLLEGWDYETEEELENLISDEYKVEKVSEKEYNINISGATITDGYSEKAIKHAELMYGSIRKRKTDVDKIAINTGYSKNIIQKIKDYLFISKHDLGGNFKRFDPDFYIAQSWDRLTKGTIEEHDLTLLKHEIMEKELIDKGFNQIEAHKITSKKYNYQKEAEEYYDKIEKSKKRK